MKNSFQNLLIEAGCDEAGRGCLAGPVVAAAVILPKYFRNSLLNDSKKLKEKDRDALRIIIEQKAVSYAVSFVDEKCIDEINILQASILAMQKAVKSLHVQPQHLAIDGNKFRPMKNISHSCLIKGDGRFRNIAAASILAKTYRDEYMQKLHKELPHFGWNNCKGYPTKAHREAIKIYGASKYHRMSFRLLAEEEV